MVFGLFRHQTYGRTDNRVRRSPYSHKGNIGESDFYYCRSWRCVNWLDILRARLHFEPTEAWWRAWWSMLCLPPPTVVVVRILHRPLLLYHPVLYQYKTCSHCPNQHRPCPCTHLIIHECSCGEEETKDAMWSDTKASQEQIIQAKRYKNIGKEIRQEGYCRCPSWGKYLVMKVLYIDILRELVKLHNTRHCHVKNSQRLMHWSNMIHWKLNRLLE